MCADSGRACPGEPVCASLPAGPLWGVALLQPHYTAMQQSVKHEFYMYNVYAGNLGKNAEIVQDGEYKRGKIGMVKEVAFGLTFLLLLPIEHGPSLRARAFYLLKGVIFIMISIFIDVLNKALNVIGLCSAVVAVFLTLKAQAADRKLPKFDQLGKKFWLSFWTFLLLLITALALTSLEVWGVVG